MYTPRLKQKYFKEIVPLLKEKNNYSSVMEVPRLEKICINRGIGIATVDKKSIEIGVEEISLIGGQRAVMTKAKKSISNFKLREEQPIGVKLTLRRNRMYDFLDRFIAIALPRVRDFQGIKTKSFDGKGNYTYGVTEHIIFPEISIEKVVNITGMDITFVTTAKTDQEAFDLLSAFSFPFKKNN